MRVRSALAAVVVALFASSALDPALARQARHGVVAGRVVDASTGAPIEGATVQLYGMAADGSGYTNYDDIETGADGRFQFRDVSPGWLSLMAAADDYRMASAGDTASGTGVSSELFLADGESLEGETLYLRKPAKISGRVTNAAGDAVKSVEVLAWRRQPSAAGRGDTFYQADWSQTGNDGEYALELLPGEYVIGVIPSRTTDRVGVNPESPCGDLIERALEEPQRGARREFIAQVAAEAQRQREHEYAPGVPLGAYYSISTVSPAPPAPPDGERRVYVNTFLGGVSDFRNAQRVIVRSGETREHTDIQLMSVTPTTIDGRVIFGDGRPLPRFAEVMLIVDERVFGMSYEASAFVDADGTFVFADVAPGHYAVEVAPHSGCGCSFDVIRNAWTRVPIDVPSTGAAGVVVPVDGPVTVSATVMLTGSAQAESAWLAVLSDDGRPDHDRSGAARQEDGGRVNIDDVSPGRYIVDARAISEDGQLLYLTSLTRGGVDLTTRALDVSGASVSDIVMTFADVPTPLSGIVIRPDGRSISDGVVVLFPVSPAAWPAWQPNSARFQSALVRHGRFEFMHVMAGEYFVVLKGEDESWSNAAEMKSLAARATPITVVGGQAKTVTVVSKR